MSNLVKVGDIVTAAESWPSWLTKGKEYKVVACDHSIVQVIGDMHLNPGGFEHKFFTPAPAGLYVLEGGRYYLR